MQNSTFYALATNKEGKAVRIADLPTNRLQADRVAREYCKKNELNFDGVHPVTHTLKQPASMSKDWKEKFAANRSKLTW